MRIGNFSTVVDDRKERSHLEKIDFIYKPSGVVIVFGLETKESLYQAMVIAMFSSHANASNYNLHIIWHSQMRHICSMVLCELYHL